MPASIRFWTLAWMVFSQLVEDMVLIFQVLLIESLELKIVFFPGKTLIEECAEKLKKLHDSRQASPKMSNCPTGSQS